MSITLNWHDEAKTVLILTFTTPWTMDDLWSAMTVQDQMVGEVSHLVDLIVDCRDIRSIPTSAITHGKNMLKNAPQRHGGVTVMVGANGLVRSLLNMITSLRGQTAETRTYLFASTLDDALAQIDARKAKRAGV